MDPINFVILFAVGIISGLFGTLVGGGSLLSLPTLLFLGLPPHMAIGTNRLGIVGLTGTGLYKFHKKGLINYKIGLAIAIPSVVASFIGANLVLQVDEFSLRYLIAVLTIVLLFFVILKPKLGIEKIKRIITKKRYAIGIILGSVMGLYNGFYGVATGVFLSYMLIFVFGQTFMEAAATRKIPGIFWSLAAFAVFAINDVIIYPLAITLFIGMSIGSYTGAHYADKIGNIWIKRLFFVIVFVMAIKLLI